MGDGKENRKQEKQPVSPRNGGNLTDSEAEMNTRIVV